MRACGHASILIYASRRPNLLRAPNMLPNMRPCYFLPLSPLQEPTLHQTTTHLGSLDHYPIETLSSLWNS
jgi:hypothetical protein